MPNRLFPEAEAAYVSGDSEPLSGPAQFHDERPRRQPSGHYLQPSPGRAPHRRPVRARASPDVPVNAALAIGVKHHEFAWVVFVVRAPAYFALQGSKRCVRHLGSRTPPYTTRHLDRQVAPGRLWFSVCRHPYHPAFVRTLDHRQMRCATSDGHMAPQGRYRCPPPASGDTHAA
jgi:hypothetical protein